MTEIAALLFDMDGTLVHTADANYAAYAAALAEAGIDIDRPDFDRLSHGMHWRQFLPLMMGSTTADAAAIAQRKQALYAGMMGMTQVNGHVLSLARAMAATCRLGLVTTASARSVAAVLDAHGLAELFDVIVTGDDVDRSKPAPDPYLLAADRLGIRPQDCLAVEDSDVGVESARSAGMGVLRIETGCISG